MKAPLIEYIKPLLITTLAVFAPIQGILITVGVVVFMDMITGIMAAMKRNEKISSAALRRSLSKLVVYQIALLSGHLIEVYLLGGAVPIVKIIAATCGSVEGLSLLENLNTISGTNILREVLIKIGSKNDEDRLDRERIAKKAAEIIHTASMGEAVVTIKETDNEGKQETK